MRTKIYVQKLDLTTKIIQTMFEYKENIISAIVKHYWFIGCDAKHVFYVNVFNLDEKCCFEYEGLQILNIYQSHGKNFVFTTK